jgi:hypothetical protein
VVELEALGERVVQLQADLALSERRCTSTGDVVSSEVQALEEENIELLKENKDLRVEVSRFKASGASAAVSGGSASGSASTHASPSVSASSASAAAPGSQPGSQSGSLSMSGSKRTFGTDISNQGSTSKSSKKGDKEKGDKGVVGIAEGEDDLSQVQSQSQSAGGAGGGVGGAGGVGVGGKSKVRRTRVKAKALVEGAAPAEEAGECKQS